MSRQTGTGQKRLCLERRGFMYRTNRADVAPEPTSEWIASDKNGKSSKTQGSPQTCNVNPLGPKPEAVCPNASAAKLRQELRHPNL